MEPGQGRPSLAGKEALWNSRSDSLFCFARSTSTRTQIEVCSVCGIEVTLRGLLKILNRMKN